MSPQVLLAWLLALPPVLDGAGHPIPRPRAAAQVIADVAAAEPDALFVAAALDTFAALESGYRTNVAGDCPGMRAGDPRCTRALGAKSYGAWQTPTAITPRDGLGQARLWVSILRTSQRACPAHPLALLGTGKCIAWGDRRQRIIDAALVVPVPEGGPT